MNLLWLKKLWPIYALGAVLFGATIIHTAYAATTISQGYSTSSTIPVGSLVSLEKNSTDRVIAADLRSVENLIGVVINTDGSLLSLSNGQDNQAQVATSGVVAVAVSDWSGEIKPGDPITASNIKGVGMKAVTNTKVVGIAQGTMTGIKKQTIKDEAGADHEVSLGQVPVLISVSYHYQTPDKTVIPAALQNVADSIAGKKVDSLPIILSGAIFLIMLITVTSIVYSMIRSSIISVGRNPMAQSAVYRDIIQLSVLVLAIIGVSLIAIYFILTRL